MTSLTAKLIVFGFMIFGHIIIIWFPGNEILRFGDYWVYPAFAYFAGVGMIKTKDLGKYIGGLVVLALISQYPYELAGVARKGQLNILWHLAGSVAVVGFAKKLNSYIPVLIALLGAFVIPNMFNTVMGIIIIQATDLVHRRVEFLRQGKLNISKYWLYLIYPGHLAVLGGLRQII
jgi:hypothetical protein